MIQQIHYKAVLSAWNRNEIIRKATIAVSIFVFNISYSPTFCFWSCVWLEALLPSFRHSFISVARCLSNFLCFQACLSPSLLLSFAVKARGFGPNTPSLKQFIAMCIRQYTSSLDNPHVETEEEIQVEMQCWQIREVSPQPLLLIPTNPRTDLHNYCFSICKKE